MALKTLSEQDLADILNGAVIYGSGGGGPMAAGQGILNDILKLNRLPVIADPSTDVDDDDTMAVPFFHSSVNAAPDIPIEVGEAISAFKELSKISRELSGRDFSFVLPVEVGAESMIPLDMAVRTGLPVIDGDSAGRAIIALTMSRYAALNIPIAPIVLANSDLAITLNVPDAAAAGGPMWASVGNPPFNGNVGLAFWAMDGKTMKPAVIPGTLSRALRLGRVLREAIAAGADPVQAVVKALGGYVLGVGHIFDLNVPMSDTAVGHLAIRSQSGEEIWVYNLRENLMAWSATAPAPIAMGPDLICYLTTDGEPVSNEDILSVYNPAQGIDKEIAIFAVPADAAFRIPAVIAVFMGFYRQALYYGGPYIPLEQLMEGRP
jgi:DUF917 family protein